MKHKKVRKDGSGPDGSRRLALSDRQLCDLELLLNGGFAPLTGFLGEDDYGTVVSSMRFCDGRLWPVPVTLDVPESFGGTVREELLLTDAYGVPRAVFTTASVYRPDRRREAELVYGTTDVTHPGVRHLLNATGPVYLGGPVRSLPVHNEHVDFPFLRRTPGQLKAMFARRGWKTVIGFQTRNPIHRGHFELLRRAAADIGGHVLIHPAVGVTKPGDIDHITRVRCYEYVQKRFGGRAVLSLLPVAMRMAGPREAVWHALIRKNYGCTHFIVGRDHAGPGNDAKGKPFYGPYEAQELALRYAGELGIGIYAAQEVVHVRETGKFRFVNEIPKGRTVDNISGTRFREMLRNDERVPGWYSFPEVIGELRRAVKRETRGLAVFFTGLPSAGKSTVARALHAKLAEVTGRKVSLLDGDVVRLNLSKGLGFSKEDRDANILRIGFVANEITKHGGMAICAAVAPYRQVRDANRRLIGAGGNYVEVFVDTPLRVCEQRDVKGLYRLARAGKVASFTGISDPYEKPRSAEITLRTDRDSVRACVSRIMAYLNRKRLIPV